MPGPGNWFSIHKILKHKIFCWSIKKCMFLLPLEILALLYVHWICVYMSVNMFHFLFWSVHKRYFLTCTRYFVPPYFKAQNACLVHCQYMSSLYTRDFGPPYRRLSEDVRAQVPVDVVVVCFFDFCLLITIMTMVNLSAHWWDNQEAQVSPAHWGRKKTPSQKVRTSSLSKWK